MTVGIQLGSITDEIGVADFFSAFFYTITGNLEPGGWGTRFPVIMHKLYYGQVEQPDAVDGLNELDIISGELSKLSVDKLIWDIEDSRKRPPWGSEIADTITDLSNYFVTSTGRDLIGTLREEFEELRDRGGMIRVVTY